MREHELAAYVLGFLKGLNANTASKVSSEKLLEIKKMIEENNEFCDYDDDDDDFRESKRFNKSLLETSKELEVFNEFDDDVY